MARLAIFIDGGYIDAIARREAGVRVDLQKLVTQVAGRVQTQNAEALDLFRSFYYTCPTTPARPTSMTHRARKIGNERANSAAFVMPLSGFPDLRSGWGDCSERAFVTTAARRTGRNRWTCCSD